MSSIISLQVEFDRYPLISAPDRAAASKDLAALFERLVIAKQEDMAKEEGLRSVELISGYDARFNGLIQSALSEGVHSDLLPLFFSFCRAKDTKKVEAILQAKGALKQSAVEKAVEISIDVKDAATLNELLLYKVQIRVSHWIDLLASSAFAGDKNIVNVLLAHPPFDEQSEEELACVEVAKLIFERDYKGVKEWFEDDSQVKDKACLLALSLGVVLEDVEVVSAICACKGMALEESLQSKILQAVLIVKAYSILKPLLTHESALGDKALLKAIFAALKQNDKRFIRHVIALKPHLLQFRPSLQADAALLESIADTQPYVYFFADPKVSCYSKLGSIFHEYWMCDPKELLSIPVVDFHYQNALDSDNAPWQHLQEISGIERAFGLGPLEGTVEKVALSLGRKIAKSLKEENIGGKYSDSIIQAFERASSTSKDKNKQLLSDFFKGLPVVILTGYIQHYIAAVLYQNHMLIINRAASIEQDRVVYHSIDPKKVTQDVIDKIMLCVNAKSFQVTALVLYKQIARYLSPTTKEGAITINPIKHAVEEALSRRIQKQKAGNCNAASWKKAFDAAVFLLAISDKEMPKSIEEASVLAKYESDRLSCKLRSDACLDVMREGFTLALSDKELLSQEGKVSLFLAANYKMLKKKCRIVASQEEIEALAMQEKEYRPYIKNFPYLLEYAMKFSKELRAGKQRLSPS